MSLESPPVAKSLSFWQYIFVLVITAVIGLISTITTNHFTKPDYNAEAKKAISKQADENLLPSGMIIAYYSKTGTVPAGWVPCDGLNNTPDLRNRYIIGNTGLAGNGDSVGEGTGAVRIPPSRAFLTQGLQNEKVLRTNNSPVYTDPNTPAKDVINAFVDIPEVSVALTSLPASVKVLFIMKQ